ncbi:hypothetical protein TVAG_188310 [Trichomonas vaginalis G3]|uniref:EF-hand domain-containing protein n=1 Tax=Trichomonas vaginalis (strain ATCC PRA-98 / G3) TaxID=412133 RepID=A2DV53_TRIV3|nr:EF-hand family [Trichomonas vaginalis G3]EAY15780.1 hypothetical protein TVAG_188310 [Trichomonas vaginalis G3]KAI5486551.1 EF-hand family [Trichomonas vaginalis G3]|eukprot:XP_001328003.1 hypothetical protein [Trichomonas vaginalis G3]
MGSSQSNDIESAMEYKERLSTQYQVSETIIDTMYEKYELACGNSKVITFERFDTVFPIIDKTVKSNMLKYLEANHDNSIEFTGFFKLYLSLRPSLTNTTFRELLFSLFKTEDNNFDVALFISELKANMLFTCKGADKEFEQYFDLKPGEHTIEYSSFKKLTESFNSPILLYGKQYVFGSYIFQ